MLTSSSTNISQVGIIFHFPSLQILKEIKCNNFYQLCGTCHTEAAVCMWSITGSFVLQLLRQVQTERCNMHACELCLSGGYEDRLCGLVVRVPGYRYRGPGLIPGTTRFSEK
jgi:hypothetical protein